MKTTLIFGYLTFFISAFCSAQMSEIKKIKVRSEQGMIRFSKLTEVLTSKDFSGKIEFVKDDSKKIQLAQYGIVVSDCLNEQKRPAYCLDKENEGKLIGTMRKELVESIALKNIYLRALSAVGTNETRQELRTENQKNLQARKQIDQYAENVKLSQTKKISAGEVASEIGPALGFLVIVSPVYALPALIFYSGAAISKMAFGVVAATLFGSAGGLMMAERGMVFEFKKEILTQHVREAEQKLSVQMRIGYIIDEAILESQNK